MGDTGTDLKSLSSKLDKLLSVVEANTAEIQHVKTQYASLNVDVNHLQSN